MMERKDAALAAFAGGCNCAQAVLLAYCEDFGLDEPTALGLCEGLGGGMAGRGMLCGALSGGALVLGLYAGRREREDGEAEARVNSLVNQLFSAFGEKHGHLDCSGLLGYDMASEEGHAASLDVRREKCPCFVADTCLSLDEILLAG